MAFKTTVGQSGTSNQLEVANQIYFRQSRETDETRQPYSCNSPLSIPLRITEKHVNLH